MALLHGQPLFYAISNSFQLPDEEYLRFYQGMKDLRELRKFYEKAASKQDLVLCTLVRKTGSSYRALGAKKIVSASASCGFLSGGCLEASIEKTARERKTEMPFIESFSSLAEEDRLLGYQTGCQGVIEILFEIMQQHTLELLIPFGEHALAEGVGISLSGGNLGARKFSAKKDAENLFFDPWVQPIELIIIGCGPDADAYLPLADSLGWDIRFVDYRSSFLRVGRFANAPAYLVPIEKMAAEIPSGLNRALIIMTHNYEADLEIMRQIRGHRFGYVGCLGPALRFERMQKDLAQFHGESLSKEFLSKVFAPAGIFKRSNTPEAIALSVVAQVQETLVEPLFAHAWVLLLAAGQSSRFGSVKALAQYRGKSFLEQALDEAQEFAKDQVLVVTGGHAKEIQEFLNGHHSHFNDDWKAGMGTSISSGLQAILDLDNHADVIVVLPVDQPGVQASHLRELARMALQSQRCALTVGKCGNFGTPAAIPKGFFAKAKTLNGDRGMKSLLQPAEMIFIKSEEAFIDIDRPEDLVNLEIL